jgi:hypothetical protein
MWFRSSSTDKLFEGEISEESFHLQRIIRGRNSFLPQIYGHIKPCESGARVFVTMRIHWFTGVFMTFWVGFLTFCGFKTYLGRFEGRSTFPESVLPFVMVMLGFALTLWGFLPEVDKAKRLLFAQINAKTVDHNLHVSEKSRADVERR